MPPFAYVVEMWRALCASVLRPCAHHIPLRRQKVSLKGSEWMQRDEHGPSERTRRLLPIKTTRPCQRNAMTLINSIQIVPDTPLS